MIVFITKHSATGQISEVNRTIEEAGRTLYGHGDGSFADGSPFTIETIRTKMEDSASIEIVYPDGDVLILERHFVAG
ncbi:hypothetical protein [Sphingomonas sp. LHG3443-2]|uniref:hypothetical protein n=1 Tax=Sphingomonas sp. LHG3443-2 TaxID=2804639 RepID=UPI003CF45590